MFQRNLRPILEKALARSPVVLLNGARQTGKTTLVKLIGQEKGYTYITFDDLHFLSLAKQDPVGFLAGIPKPVIFDEVQRAPEILLGIKKDVDEHREPGRYLVTGSANPLLISHLGEFLVGRMEILEMYPLSQGELIGKVEGFIDYAFADGALPTLATSLSKRDLFKRVLVGGYPLVQDISQEDRASWFASYLKTLVERDVKDLANVAGLTELPFLLRLLATRAGNLLNIAEVSRVSGVALTTLRRYLALLKALFIIDFQQPWASHEGKRLVKTPKLYMIDAGLLSYLLAITLNTLDAENKLVVMGSILENFVFNELTKQSTWSSKRVTNYHYRTQTGTEVDFVLEDDARRIVGLEVKSASTLIPNDFKGLMHLQQEMGKNFAKGIILYTGAQYIPMNKQIFALPISSLWTM